MQINHWPNRSRMGFYCCSCGRLSETKVMGSNPGTCSAHVRARRWDWSSVWWIVAEVLFIYLFCLVKWEFWKNWHDSSGGTAGRKGAQREGGEGKRIVIRRYKRSQNKNQPKWKRAGEAWSPGRAWGAKNTGGRRGRGNRCDLPQSRGLWDYSHCWWSCKSAWSKLTLLISSV